MYYHEMNVWLRCIPHKLRIVTLHRSTTCVYAAYCYRPSSVVCRSVSRSHYEPCKNHLSDRVAVWFEDSGGPKNHGVQIPHGKWQFWGGKGRTIVKYRDTLRSYAQKRLNPSICRLGCGVKWAEGCTSSIVFARWRQCALMGGYIAATWRIQLNHPSMASMRFMSNYFVIFGHEHLDSRTDSRTLRAEYCIVDFKYNTAI